MLTKGFTLIEIILAIAVLAVVFPAIVSLLSLSTFTTSQGEKYTQAYSITQKEMENVFSNKQGGLTDGTVVSNELFFTKTVMISSVQRCGYTICSSGGTADNDTKKVNINVSWTERDPLKPAKVEIEAYVSKI